MRNDYINLSVTGRQTSARHATGYMKDEIRKFSALSAKPAAHTWVPPMPHARASLQFGAGLEQIDDLDPWLAAKLLGDEFQEIFLWSSDCGSQRFAALGSSLRVDLADLGDAVVEAGLNMGLPRAMIDRLPLGLFVSGQTDQRPGAFASGETESASRSWIPRVLLLQQDASVLVICVDANLRRHVAQRLRRALSSAERQMAELALRGDLPSVREANVEDRHAWRQRVEAGLAAISGRHLQKVVVSRRMEITPSRGLFSAWASAWQAQKGLGRNRFAISSDGGRSMFLGATPETLLRIDGGELTTHALAGTLNGDASIEHFLASPKLREEHNYVTDGLAATLAPFTDHLVAEPLAVRQAGTVSHLETPLVGQLRDQTGAVEIMQALHPTPAIGGWPRRAALDSLDVIEPYSRGWFAAPLGWLAPNGNAHAAIAIRSQWVSPQRAVMLAGAGIVRGSDPDLEWHETESKFDNMRCVLRGRFYGG